MCPATSLLPLARIIGSWAQVGMLYSLLHKGAFLIGNWSVFQKAMGFGKNNTFEMTIICMTENLHRHYLLQNVHHVGMRCFYMIGLMRIGVLQHLKLSSA